MIQIQGPHSNVWDTKSHLKMCEWHRISQPSDIYFKERHVQTDLK